MSGPTHGTDVLELALSSLPRGAMRLLEAGDLRICVARDEDGEVFAVDDTCTHEEESLSDGWLDGSCLECPAHNAIFDLRTGDAVALPAVEPLTTYPVTVTEGVVRVVLSAEETVPGESPGVGTRDL